MTTQPSITSDIELARFVLKTRANVNELYDGKIRHAQHILDLAVQAFEAVKADIERKRAAENEQVLAAIADAAALLVASLSNETPARAPAPSHDAREENVQREARSTGVVPAVGDTGHSSTSIDQVGEAASPASALGVAPAEVTTGQPSTSAADVAPRSNDLPGRGQTLVPPEGSPAERAADGSVDGNSTNPSGPAAPVDQVAPSVRDAAEPGPRLGNSPGVLPPRPGDKVRLQGGGIGEIVDAMMGAARVKDGPTTRSIKFALLVQNAPNSEAKWSEKLEAKPAPAAGPVASEPAAPADPATSAAKERRDCDRCGTKNVLVLPNGGLRGHLAPDKRKCPPELAHEITKKPKADEPEPNEWPSAKTAVDDKAGELF